MGDLLIILGGIVALVGHIMVLLVAFRVSILWGLGCLCIPLIGLIFIITHFEESKGALYAYLLGIALQLAGFMFFGGHYPYGPRQVKSTAVLPVFS